MSKFVFRWWSQNLDLGARSSLGSISIQFGSAVGWVPFLAERALGILCIQSQRCIPVA